MQIVIDIPEELYKANLRGLEAEELWDLRIAMKNGTPLPKGHGRLIDADKINLAKYVNVYNYSKYSKVSSEYKSGYNSAIDDVINIIVNAPTIIEADTESEG